MSNQKRLKEYLLGNKEKNKFGYMKSDISNGKVIMLSGKWGSGKTHFWKNVIATEDLKNKLKKDKKAYTYVSLYGKTTLEAIETDLFIQAYNSITGDADFISKTCSVFTKIGEKIAPDGLSNSFKGAQKLVDDDKTKKGKKYLFDGGIICFDDFERKSKDVDLSDLFGFISHLAIDLNCKVMIILNDDVFKGAEKDVFSNVKEKTVSKFLKYEPSIKELFDLIFDEDIEKDAKKEKKYKDLEQYKEVILKTIEETEELNARIYIQVLDNLVEWVDKRQELNDDILRSLILVNINFILNHKVYQLLEIKYQNQEEYDPRNPDKNTKKKNVCFVKSKYSNNEIFLDIISKMLSSSELEAINNYESINKKSVGDFVKDLLKDKSLVNSAIFNKRHNIFSNIDESIFSKINNFIETGILIDE